MQFFLDTANLDEITQWSKSGLVDGVTTNPSLIARSGKTREEMIEQICRIISGPVSAEVLSTEAEPMLAEALQLYEISSNIVIKLPLTPQGLQVCSLLYRKKIPTNVTLCFSPLQALLAAKAGATYISPFVGRLDDIGSDGMSLIQDIRTIYDHYPSFHTKILVASVRHPQHVLESARLGADVVTLPAKVLQQLFHHPLTDSGLEAFLKDASQQTV